MLTHEVNDRLSGDAESLRMAKRAGQMLQITPSDREALRLLATGRSTGDVAAGLGISAVEMATQLERLFAAMGSAIRLKRSPHWCFTTPLDPKIRR
jgi:DNA-binding CsgD family transcriptional regulator